MAHKATTNVKANETNETNETNEANKTNENEDAPMTEDTTKLDAQSLIETYGSKSNAIRALAKQGMSTGDIARALDISYQHARNVRLRPLKREIKAEREAKANANFNYNTSA